MRAVESYNAEMISVVPDFMVHKPVESIKMLRNHVGPYVLFAFKVLLINYLSDKDILIASH